ncbi:MAG: nuclear transport factor 2 family protein [Gordonia sp.]|nr:nuclear transport factor 2 family protein [Gordonia sp. (in: high G+C Gram-positive bacteria)]
MDFEELIARELVRDRYAQYNRSGDKGRLDELAACFTEDGVMELRNSFVASGRTGIIDALTRTSKQLVAHAATRESFGRNIIRHHVASLRFASMTPVRIESSAYFVAFQSDAADHWGTYRDVLVKVDNDWLFESRLVLVEGARQGSLAESLKL